MKKIDIALIKPGSQKQLYQELSTSGLTGLEPPLWAALLAGFLRNLGYSVVLFDAEIEGYSYEETAQKIKEIDPLLACVVVSGTNPSASTMNMQGASNIITFLKKLDVDFKTMLFGLHPSALPERTLLEEDVHFVCQGEGFYTIPKLLDSLKTHSGRYDILGLWHKVNGRPISNPRPSLLKDISGLPLPAWDLLPMDKYRAHNWHCFGDIKNRTPYAVLYTSLGCPFRCSFCCINALFGVNTIRYRSMESVMQELEILVVTYKIKNIKIIDEMFAINEDRVIEFCNNIIERGYNLNMWAYARVDTVTDRMLACMKKAGIHWLAYGFESANQRVMEDVSKGYKNDLVKKVVSNTRSHNINICANYIFGLPEDTRDSMNETKRFMFDINAEWANIYCAIAYPGSRLFDLAIKENWPLPKTWSGYSQYSYETLPLPTRYLESQDVLEFRDHAFKEYFNRTEYLRMIEEKFGLDTLEHIRFMSSRSLERKYASSKGERMCA